MNSNIYISRVRAIQVQVADDYPLTYTYLGERRTRHCWCYPGEWLLEDPKTGIGRKMTAAAFEKAGYQLEVGG